MMKAIKKKKIIKKKIKVLHKQDIGKDITTQYDPIKVGSDSVSKDRLSDLPDEVLVYILSFLPFKDAVRTLLFRRFGNLWTLVPNLVFDYDSLEFISNVMKYHKSPTIDRWEFEGDWKVYEDIQEKLTNWVGAVLKKNPKVLSIGCGYEYYGDLELPSVFCSQSIVTLKVSNIVQLSLRYLPCRVNMESLRSLYLCSVNMVEEDLKVLEVGCPCLQELCIDSSFSLEKFHLTVPNIERLEICLGEGTIYTIDCPNVKILHIEDVCLDCLEVIDVSSVSHATIKDCQSVGTIRQFEILHKKFQNAKVFLMGDECCYKVCMQLEQCGNEKVALQQNTWSLLALKPGLQGSCLLGICRLLRSSKFLEQLIFYVDVDFFCDCSMLLLELSSPCKMRYLKTVTVRDFEKPCKTLVQLMEFLLKNAVVLDEMVIVCNKKDQLFSKMGFEFVAELLSLPRASKNARVVIA